MFMIVIRQLFQISKEVQYLLFVEFEDCVLTESHWTFHMILLARKWKLR